MSHDIFDNFFDKEVFKKIPLKVNGDDTTLKKQLQKYFDAESLKKRLLYCEFQDDKKKLTELLKGIHGNSSNKSKLIKFFQDSKSSHIPSDECKKLVSGLDISDQIKEEELLLYSVEWRKKKMY